MRGLIPWGRRGGVNVRRGEDNPFLTLHREILFDDVFHGFDLAPLGSDRFFGRINGNWHWPNIEVNETDKEVKVSAELPSLDVVNGVLPISGEKKTDTEGNNRLFSERHYGRFQRREDVDEDKVSAAFKNGLLTVTLLKAPLLAAKVKHIAINAK